MYKDPTWDLEPVLQALLTQTASALLHFDVDGCLIDSRGPTLIPDLLPGCYAKDVFRGEPESTELLVAGLENGGQARVRCGQKVLDLCFVPQSKGDENVGVLCIATDVTRQTDLEVEQEHLQARLEKAKTMEAIGQLTGGAAHDLNNVLAAVLGHSTLLRFKLGTKPGAAASVDSIEHAADRAAEITGRLLGLVRKTRSEPELLDMNTMLMECARATARAHPKLKVKYDLDPRGPRLRGLACELKHAIMNLLTNAAEAMPNGGEITVGSELAKATSDLSAPTHVRLSISDCGPGVAARMRDKIFEPLCSTKATPMQGMGLPVARALVRSHGGSLTLINPPQGGSTFEIDLGGARPSDPDRDKAPATPPSSSQDAVVSSPGARVLLVDDDDMVRLTGRALLEELGYEVVTARDGPEALSYYDKNIDAVDAVILDVVMPGMSGPECFRSLKSIDPTVRALLTSGFDKDESAADALNEGIVDFLPKPYTIDKLASAIQRVLEKPS